MNLFTSQFVIYYPWRALTEDIAHSKI